MPDTLPAGCTPEVLVLIDSGLAERGWRVLRRVQTPDRVIDWLTVDPEGSYWLIRAIWPPPGHPIGRPEIEGMLDALTHVPGWKGWLLVDGEVSAEALALAGNQLCLSNIEAIFPQGGH